MYMSELEPVINSNGAQNLDDMQIMLTRELKDVDFMTAFCQNKV